MSDMLFLQVIGGVALLLYGVRLTGQGFELAFGGGLQRLWNPPGSGRLRSFVAGVLGTGLIQSSGAVVTLLMSFAQVIPVSLIQSLYAVLGADVGSILIIQILSFRIHQIAFPVVTAGVVLHLWGRRGPVRAVGQGVLGFGFILLSLRLLSAAAAEVGQVESLRLLMADLGRAPLVGFAWGTLLAAIFQSGTALMIALIAFVQQGVLPVQAALPLVLGANVGGTSIAFVAASGLAAEGRRIAWGHLLIKLAGAVLFLALLVPVQRLLLLVTPDATRIVANAHTLFNVVLVILFFPLVPRLAPLLVRMVPEKRSQAPRWHPVYLDRQHLPVAGAALGQVAREILRMTDMIQEMLDTALQAVQGGEGEELADRIAKADDDVDNLTREIKVFLSDLGEGVLDADQTRLSVASIAIVSDLENIGDLIDKTLGEHIRKMARRQQWFSEEGAGELADFMTVVGAMYREAVSAFVTRDRKIVEGVIARKRVIGQMERDLRIAHIRRLQKGTPESLETSAAHLDILSSLKVISSHCTAIAYNILEMEG